MKSSGTCLQCGELLPKGSSRCRLYCPECSRKRNIEQTIKRQQQARKARAALAAQRVENADKAYCRECIYYGAKVGSGNLCDYILHTGIRRGCKAGEGCERRKIRRSA